MTDQNTDIRRDILESNSVKAIMDIAEFGNQEIGFKGNAENDELSMYSMYKIPLRHAPEKLREVYTAV